MALRNIIAVTAAATNSNLVTLARVKEELGISGSSSDNILKEKIAEASADIEAALGFRVPKETVTETFWHGRDAPFVSPEYLLLRRTPVISIDSVTLDDVAVDSSLFRLDDETGQVYALNPSGLPWIWQFIKAITVAYSGGYVLPDQTGATLPAGIQGAALELVADFWAAKGRDPSAKSIETFGVDRVDYWVGAVGDPSELPPRVLMKLAPFRRPVV